MKKVFQSTVIALSVVGLLAVALPARSHAKADMERVLIQFMPGHKADLKQAVQRESGEIHYEFDEWDAMAVTLPARALNGIRHNPNVVLVEPDVPRYLLEQVVPYGVDHVEARDIWDSNRDGVVDPEAPTGEGLTVCIIDSGVLLGHEDFEGVDFVGGYPSDWNTDTCGHGTHVAGTIAAVNNGTGIVGVSPGNVSLYIVKVFGDNCQWTYSSTLIDAAYRCRDNGADIISVSLGGNAYSSYENVMFQTLYNEGILLVGAAGNEGGTAYHYPASYASVISVGAVDQSNVVANFSRQNDRVELAAPGVSVYSTANTGGYTYKSGTSMATPHVSAAAALVWSSDLSQSNGDIRTLLQGTALDLGPAGRDNAYGFGVVRAYEAYRELNPAPTSVELAAFAAHPDADSIRVEWETVSEVDNLGFNLYRAESPDGPWTQLNAGLIPSRLPPGSPEGATYEFVESSARPGVTCYYRLADVDVYGVATYHGPVSATVPMPSRWLLPARPRPQSAPSTLGG